MGTTWIVIDIYSAQMLPLPPYSQTDLFNLNNVTDVFSKVNQVERIEL